jgi:glutamate synthase domain-containing protein 2
MIRMFYTISALTFLTTALVSYFLWTPFLATLIFTLPVFIVGVIDTLQKSKGVRRNFPVLGNLRYFFELIRPELQQYFVESNQSGRPIPRELRSVVYQRSKGQMQTVPFGSQLDMDKPGHEWVAHSMNPVHVSLDAMRVTFGEGPRAYSASILNVSAMSYGSLSGAAIKALNLGAAKGGFYHNTGEGGLSRFHLSGGDVVWQIGTGYFGCRNEDGTFSRDKFVERVKNPRIKMVEIKLSQGAKPGKGGLLPGAKVTPLIAEARGVPVGKECLSPASHSAFNGPKEFVLFLKEVKQLAEGRPIGFKLCVGKKSEFVDICKAMIEVGFFPDFITVDGSEGGTGAAPLEFTNYIGLPLFEGLAFVHDTLVQHGLRKKVKVIASSKVFTGFDILTRLAMGADAVNSARGMMLALGCIQALKCHTNHCPVGVTTHNPQLERGLYVPDKAERVARFHAETVHAFADMLGALGYTSPSQLRRSDVFRRTQDGSVKTYEEIYPPAKASAAQANVSAV